MRYLRIIVFLGLFIFSLGRISFIAGEDISQEKAVIEAFNAYQVELLKTSIFCKGSIDHKVLTPEDHDIEPLKNIGEKVLSLYEVDDACTSREQSSSDHYLEYEMFAQTIDDEYLRIKVFSERQENTEDFNSYITVEVFQDKGYIDFDGHKDKVEKGLSPYTSNLRTNSNIMGTYGGKMDEQQLNRMSDKMFGKSKAKNVKPEKEGNAITVTAEHSLVENTEKRSHEGLDFELSARYSDYDDKTYILLRSPPE